MRRPPGGGGPLRRVANAQRAGDHLPHHDRNGQLRRTPRRRPRADRRPALARHGRVRPGGYALGLVPSALSTEMIDVYVACGDVKGTPKDDQSQIDLKELNSSGYQSMAW